MLTFLPTSGAVAADIPLVPARAAEIRLHRAALRDVLNKADDRIVVIVGPCSIHDPVAALDYARGLAAAAQSFTDDLIVVLRAYLEKPRSIVGWKGLVHDPGLDGSGDLSEGLRIGRQFLIDAAATGLPLAGEFVDPLVASYLADVFSYAAIGARTVTSQPHRQLASWLPMPVGCKNTVDGDVEAAINAMQAAAQSHIFPGIGVNGIPVVHRSQGNPYAHLVLRGGSSGPNYTAHSVQAALHALGESALPERVVIDASHGNSGKDHRRQPAVVTDIGEQIASGQSGIVGVMIESFLLEGKQSAPIEYGKSITDACIGFPETVALLDVLATSVRRRRVVARRRN
ncbi:3-deoxy-7-phosphoheptulonate synthase [Nocardia miyunensis]|uniref:3-deoxy-7-phosphoheptulonate synthase n=1 Tax=Nocardia miyunensis TaxID=282684 RepID=UPI001C3F82EF|nr:3-deoxy-7-phosphoheptulonate synthase [Nocardia miyunensis]